MINRVQSYYLLIRRNWTLFLLISIAVSLTTACNDKEDTPKPGLTVSNLCFTITGGNVSNTLIADNEWSILVPGDDPWISVSPSSGSASSVPINLIFSAEVNNNPQSRGTIISVRIGDAVYTYAANQDGTIDQVCIN